MITNKSFRSVHSILWQLCREANQQVDRQVKINIRFDVLEGLSPTNQLVPVLRQVRQQTEETFK